MITIPRRVTAPGMVLFLLCLMYFITYVDRVNVGTAGPAIKGELGLTNTELGLVFSAFAVVAAAGGYVLPSLGFFVLTSLAWLWVGRRHATR